ncbi:hypothetical protein STEG23_027831 [Scotinomys teguina]
MGDENWLSFCMPIALNFLFKIVVTVHSQKNPELSGFGRTDQAFPEKHIQSTFVDLIQEKSGQASLHAGQEEERQSLMSKTYF